MIVLGLLGWLRGTVFKSGISKGDPVVIDVDSESHKAWEYGGEQGHIEEIISNQAAQDGHLYGIRVIETGDIVYLNRGQFELL